MKKFMLIRQPFVVLIMCLLTSCTGVQQNLENKKSEIRSNYAVRERNALDALALARLEDPYLAELEEKSVAQIVFPKAVKAGIILGAKYSEGFIMKDGVINLKIVIKGSVNFTKTFMKKKSESSLWKIFIATLPINVHILSLIHI